jgi:hypothetical protein
VLVFLAKYLLVERKGIINVIMHKNSTASDVLQSFIHALVMAKLMQKSTPVYLESQSWMDKHYEVFLQKVSLSIFLNFNKLLVYLTL